MKKKPTTETPKTFIKVKFLLSPTGRFNLGFSIGDVAEFEPNTAKELIDAAYAELVK